MTSPRIARERPAYRTALVALLLALLCTLHATPAHGFAERLDSRADESNGKAYACSGMYQPGSGGSGPSEIEVSIDSVTRDAFLVVFNIEDQSALTGLQIGDMKHVCGKQQIEQKLCTQDQYGMWLNNTDITLQHPALMTNISQADQKQQFKYSVSATGYYCAYIMSNGGGMVDISATVEWRNPYGELPSLEYPKLLFYGVISIIYLVLGVLWMLKSFFYWRDILPVQHYISGVMLVLMIEMSVNYGYWSDFNTSGTPSSALLALVVLLNAVRTSTSLFVLLIVALGYGVVKPTLGSTMRKCLLLTYTHFAFDVLYSAGTMLTRPESAGIYVLFFVLPLSVTMTAFYSWTFQALQATMQHLENRKQAVKKLMYRRLWRLLAFSLILVFLFFLVNAVYLSHRNDISWAKNVWKYRWFLIDGWMNILYMVVFVSICYLWRPTSNNQRYGLEELATDDFDMSGGDLEGGLATGTAGIVSIKLREQRGPAGSDATINEQGPTEESIFDIGDGDDWLDDDATQTSYNRELHSDRRSPTRDERDRLHDASGKMN